MAASPEATLSQFKAARDVGARITIHVGVGEFGRNALLEKLNAEKGLKDDTTYIHCCTLNDTEWKLIKDTGGTISIAGYVETLMGHGNPPVQKAIDMGIRPSLSVDVETSVPNDFFTQMRTVFSLQKNEVWAKRLSGDKNPPKFLQAVREVLEFATVEGARANGAREANAARSTPRQRGRHRHAAHRPAQHHAGQQRGRRGRHQHDGAERRHGADRRARS